MNIRHDGIIDQGATFYQEFEVFDPRYTVEQLRAMTPTAWLIDDTDIPFDCAWTADATKAVAAVSLTREVTAELDPTKAYPWRLHVVGETETLPARYGSMSVREG